ncbi:helix-turn-helix transcriptional regulator [Sphingorhabdus sp. Alg239-R122]|uniref:helix-turn-helix domain-containing protein n=1 Tax=Sphingorhabdus sp. Alg239-R122 TaxID=2305989 RepID=UPI0013DD1649|nr:helix-turn-helix transcriptional regulator [Sphingorhabdus sp. Alg239-R122]
MGPSRIEKLTDRQKDCLRLVGDGYTSKEIARLLDISPSTVDNHLHAAVTVLQAANRAEAARFFRDSASRQKLPSQPESIADPQKSSNLRASEQNEQRSLFRQMFTLPLLGGKPNQLETGRRVLGILQIAVISLVIFTAIALITSGVLAVFS